VIEIDEAEAFAAELRAKRVDAVIVHLGPDGKFSGGFLWRHPWKGDER
jgi:hypothetical protein